MTRNHRIDMLVHSGGIVDLSDRRGRKTRRAFWVFVAAAFIGSVALAVLGAL